MGRKTMKQKLITLSLLFSISLYSQVRKVTLDWLEPQFSAQSESGSLANPLFYDQETNIYSHLWEDSGHANPGSLQIRNIVYQDLPADQLQNVSKSSIPQDAQFSIISHYARNQIYTILEHPAIVRQNGAYKKIVSLEVSYSYKQPPQKNLSGITNSILASGNWYRFKVEKTGVHKIDRSFLENLGMDVSSIDPRKIKIYGNGSLMLPYLNNQTLSYDLVENAIQVVGEQDGSFDSQDHILFYGISAEYNEASDTHHNVYDDNAYYYITADGEYGKRIQNYLEPSGSAQVTITQFNDYQFHEIDEMNPAMLGRRWYGNRFDINNEQAFEFNFPNIVLGQPVDIRLVLIGISEVETYIKLNVNGQDLSNIMLHKIMPTSYTSASIKIHSDNFAAPSENITVNLSYNNMGNPASNAFVDYIALNALRHLTAYGKQMIFRYDAAAELEGIGQYILSNATQISQIWDVTDPHNVTTKINQEGASNFTIKATMGQVRKYLAIDPTDYYLPVAVNQPRVANQNLKGTIFLNNQGEFEDIDYLIITSSKLLQPALRLANHHRTVNGLRVRVVTTDKIYNEFSTGKQDIAAIRNFIKYVYDNGSSDIERLKYVCLFGDTSVDYKNFVNQNNNMVPTYHKRDSGGHLSTVSTFFSDDFYGMMDQNEGRMGNTERQDIAIGRIVVDNVSLANAMVDKIIAYYSEVSYGNWRNNAVFISDDVDKEQDIVLQFSLNDLADLVWDNRPSINVIKIHSDSYLQETSAGGNRYPKVNEAIENAIDVGALVFNYFGHGGEDGLAHEYIVTKFSVQNYKNRNKYPLFITITCEFSRFDNPLRPTGGEYAYWNVEGGFIGLITTTRKLYVDIGINTNELLATHMFGLNTGVSIRNPAESLMVTKNSSSKENRFVIAYMGDPALHLAFGKKEVKLTTINGAPISSASDTLKALSKIRLGGEVVDSNGNLVTNYNGILEAKVFDKDLNRRTLGNDNISDENGLVIMDFKTLGETIFNGKATITNGKFEFEFVVPRDIAMPVGHGRVNLYAKRDGSLEDHAGYNDQIKVGGLNLNAPEDNQGPKIRLYMNDRNFVDGGITNNSPLLIADFEDENGINTSSGIGHDIVAILDGDESEPFILNQYYQSEVDDYTKGSLTYRLRNLEEGLHTLTVKAWDVYNNSSVAEIHFVVVGDDKIKLERVLNYPNPFVNYTEFWFNHNRPFEPLEVQVQVFTVTGKVVWTRNQVVVTDGFLSRDITWDGRDDFGDRIGKGVYIYKLTVKSTLTGKKAEKTEKLVIL